MGERRKQIEKSRSALRVQSAWVAVLMLVTFVSGGATCARRRPIADFAPPVVFNQVPTQAELIARINRSLNIQSLESNTLTISSPDIIAKLSGNMRWERPHNFHLVAYPGMQAMGVALAAGSNSEMFWLQTQRPSPTIYFAKHDEFESQSGERKILPVSPLWLREALGVVELDPNGQHEGPTVRADGKLEMVSYIPSPRGAYRRVLVLDSQTSAMEQTLLYNHVGKLVAIAQQSEHEYFSEVDSILPHKVIIQLQPDEGPPLAFTVEMGFPLLNEPNTDATAFVPPDPTGLSTINLVEANQQLQQLVPTPPVYTQSKSGSRDNSLINFRRLR